MTFRFIGYLLLTLAATQGCKFKGHDGPQMGPVTQLNSGKGTLGLFTFPYYTSLLALDGGGAVVSWMRQEGAFRPIVFRHAASADAPFGEEQFLTPDSQRDAISIAPQLVPGTTSGEIYAMWQARRQATGDKFVMFRRSEDGGKSWEPDKRVNTQATSFLPSVAADPDGAIYAAWTDERKLGFKIFFNRSLDHGATWLPDDVLVEGLAAKFGTAISVDVASDGHGGVLIVWEENSSSAGGRRVRAASSRDRGTTWSEPSFVDDGTNPLSPIAPTAAFVDGHAVAVWTAAVSGDRVLSQVWSDTSPDGGVTWGKDVKVSETQGGVQARVQLLPGNGKGRLIYHSGPLRGPWAIHYTETTGDGSWSADTVVSTGDVRFLNPRLAVDRDGALYAIYEEYTRRVLLSHSIDGGHTWKQLEEPVFALPPDASGFFVHYPQLAVSDGVVYALWEVWGAGPKSAKPTLADTNRPNPADLFIRRITFPRSSPKPS
jgi:hypothetical protein